MSFDIFNVFKLSLFKKFYPPFFFDFSWNVDWSKRGYFFSVPEDHSSLSKCQVYARFPSSPIIVILKIVYLLKIIHF